MATSMRVPISSAWTPTYPASSSLSSHLSASSHSMTPPLRSPHLQSSPGAVSPVTYSAPSVSASSSHTGNAQLLKDTLTQSGEKRKRNPLACESCRSKKAKCDGLQPICTNCAQRSSECLYRAYSRKSQRVDDYVRELEIRLARFEQSPQRAGNSPGLEASGSGLDILTSAVSLASRRDGLTGDESDDNSGDGAADGMGVPGDRDNTTFFGNSAISTVFRSIRPSIQSAPPSGEKLSPSAMATPKSSGSLPSVQDDHALPPRHMADALLAAYWNYVHSLYPFLDERSYREKYARFWTEEGETDPIEVAIFYLKIALGAHFMGDTLKPPESTAMAFRFFKRARDALRFHVMTGGTLRLIQALLLVGQFAQSGNQPNYCWNMVGLAVRMALGLGLHLEGEHVQNLSETEREIRRRTFWLCFVMDRMVSTTYGRPTSIREDMSSVKMPSPNPNISIAPAETLDPGQPDLVCFLEATVRLSRLQGAVLDTLYAQTGALSSDKIPIARLLELDLELKSFEESLPYFLKVSTPASIIPWVLTARQRNVLRMRTLNVKVLLHRPCLLVSVKEDPSEKKDTQASEHVFSLETPVLRGSAHICLEASRQTIELIHATHMDRNKSGAVWYSVYYCFQGVLSLLLLKLHIDKGYATDLEWTARDEAALDKATEVLEHLSNKSAAAAACYTHIISVKQRAAKDPPTEMAIPAPAPASVHSSLYTTTPQFAVPVGLEFPPAGPTNPDWAFDSLFTSASLPVPWEVNGFGQQADWSNWNAYDSVV